MRKNGRIQVAYLGRCSISKWNGVQFLTTDETLFNKNDVINPKDWEQEINSLEAFFKGIDLPESIKLNAWTTLINVQSFLDSHFAVVKANADNPTFLPYLCRLQELKKILL
jgi:hypothetical protein